MLWSEATAHIRSAADAAWAASLYARIPLLHKNAPETSAPNMPETFVLCVIEGTFSEKTIYGGSGMRTSQEGGLVFFHAFVPAGTGSAEAEVMVETLTSALELQVLQSRIFLAGAEPAQSGDLGDASLPGVQPGGAYYRVSGSVPFNVISTR